MKRATLYWLAVPLLATLVSYMVATGMLRGIWSLGRPLDPAIEFPVRLELGDHEQGELVVWPFTIANRGGRDLFIEDIESNCSCTGMEQESGGQFTRVESLKIGPGARADLKMRVSVRGVPVGVRMLSVVTFRTNDPTQPTGRIEAVVRRVSGGISVWPECVVFGSVPVGKRELHTVDIWDMSAHPRGVARVEVSQPDQVTARLLPMGERIKKIETGLESTRIGQIEVAINTEKPTDMNAIISVHLTGEPRKPDTFAVVGSVVAPFEIAPSSLVLPRASESGPVFNATCLCTNTEGQPFQLLVDPAPSGLTVEPAPEMNGSSRLVEITWNPDRVKGSDHERRHVLRFRAVADKRETVVELQVILRP